MGQKCQYLAQSDQKCIFGTNFAVFGPKILIIMGGSKIFDTHITEKHLGTLFALFFSWALDQIGQKGRYLAKSQFTPKFGYFFLQKTPRICFSRGLEINSRDK